MPITYATRTAVQQAPPITLRISSRAQLPTSYGGMQSTYGDNVILDSDYSAAPANGGAANFPVGNGNVITVDRSAMTGFNNAGECPVSLPTSVIFTLGDRNNVAGTITVDCARTPMPASGSTVQSRFAPTFTPPSTTITYFTPPQPILDSAGFNRAAFGNDATLTPSASAGTVYMMRTGTMTIQTEKKFEGLDITTAGNGQMSWRPKDAFSGNWGLWSGVYLGSNTRPILIDANLAGVEVGRFNIHLSDPTWDALLNQPPASASMRDILPCNVGWYAVLGANVVSPPGYIVFNEDMTKYWIYVIQAWDANVTAAIFNSGWGVSSFEALWINANLITQGVGGEVQIIGAVGNPSLLMQNTGEFHNVALPPFPAVISMSCVPCNPLQISGSGWLGRHSL